MKGPNFENEREWRRFLASELKDIRGEVAELRKEVGLVQIALKGLKVTVAGVASFVSAIIAVALKKTGLS